MTHKKWRDGGQSHSVGLLQGERSMDFSYGKLLLKIYAAFLNAKGLLLVGNGAGNAAMGEKEICASKIVHIVAIPWLLRT